MNIDKVYVVGASVWEMTTRNFIRMCRAIDEGGRDVFPSDFGGKSCQRADLTRLLSDKEYRTQLLKGIANAADSQAA